MRISPIVFSRAIRSRVHASKLADLARRDSQRSWSHTTAQVLEVALRNEAPLEWSVISRFAELPPSKKDVESLLPLLESKALNPRTNSQDIGFVTLGDLAVQVGLAESLSPRFVERWLSMLRRTNPYKAIQIWKMLDRNGIHTKELGVSLYLAANQLDVASEIALGLTAIPNGLIREFISKYIKIGNVEETQKWINLWQAPDPGDVRWLYHHVRGANLQDQLILPKTSERVYFPEPIVKIGDTLRGLISRTNRIITNEPELLDNKDVKDQWILSMSNPKTTLVQELILLIARITSKAADSLGEWVAIMKLAEPEVSISILRLLPFKLPSRAFAAVISRTNSSEQLTEILELIEPETLYSAECLSALAFRQPTVFLEIMIPPELLETTLDEHHLIALWSADPAPEVQEWLLPLTIKSLDSARLLRAALHSLARQQNPEAAAHLLFEFVINRKLHLDPRVYCQGNETKLPRPIPSNISEEMAKSQIESALNKLFPGNEQ